LVIGSLPTHKKALQPFFKPKEPPLPRLPKGSLYFFLTVFLTFFIPALFLLDITKVDTALGKSPLLEVLGWQELKGAAMKAFSIRSIPILIARSPFIQDDPPGMAVQIQAALPGYAQLPASVIEKDVLLVMDKLPPGPAQRLVVLVPPGEIDETSLARRVWQIASGSRCDVFYLALSPDALQSAHQRRRLADLSVVTSGKNVHAHAHVSAEKSWQRALEKILKPGDLLVCLASHMITRHLAWRVPFGEQLVTTAGVPVLMLGGFTIGRTPNEQQVIKGVLGWTAFISLLAVFLGVQVGIDRSTTPPLSTVLLCLSVMVELYLLWKINEWIG
jgi:hypothetical protein